MPTNNDLRLHAAAQYILLILVLAVNSDRFQMLQSYTLLLKPPILMHSCFLSAGLVAMAMEPIEQ